AEAATGPPLGSAARGVRPPPEPGAPSSVDACLGSASTAGRPARKAPGSKPVRARTHGANTQRDATANTATKAATPTARTTAPRTAPAPDIHPRQRRHHPAANRTAALRAEPGAETSRRIHRHHPAILC